MNDDLSDEAALLEASSRTCLHLGELDAYQAGWQEARRRAELVMACMNDLHEAIVEDRERKAWEACWDYLYQPGEKDLEKGWQAYQEKK